jgi:hypothetical protein
MNSIKFMSVYSSLRQFWQIFRELLPVRMARPWNVLVIREQSQHWPRLWIVLISQTGNWHVKKGKIQCPICSGKKRIPLSILSRCAAVFRIQSASLCAGVGDWFRPIGRRREAGSEMSLPYNHWETWGAL